MLPGLDACCGNCLCCSCISKFHKGSALWFAGGFVHDQPALHSIHQFIGSMWNEYD